VQVSYILNASYERHEFAVVVVVENINNYLHFEQRTAIATAILMPQVQNFMVTLAIVSEFMEASIIILEV
jgi:hypothetical protein